MKLLVVAAWEPELVRFREHLAGAPSGVELVLATLGVGLVEASIAMTRCVERETPAAALLLGTCGAFESVVGEARRVAVGSVVTAGAARLADASILEGDAALPGPMPAEVAFDRGLHDALVGGGAKSVQIANTVGITTSDALAELLATKTAADVEHLEAFAFARACAAAQIPCAAALGVANVVGAKGRAEWLANHVRASQEAADVAWRALGAIITSLASRTTTTAR